MGILPEPVLVSENLEDEFHQIAKEKSGIFGKKTYIIRNKGSEDQKIYKITLNGYQRLWISFTHGSFREYAERKNWTRYKDLRYVPKKVRLAAARIAKQGNVHSLVKKNDAA